MIDGRKLIVLDVFAGDETPYYYAADGVMEAYTRMGNESVVVDATEHKRLVLRGKKTTYDVQSSGYRQDDYSYSMLRARYKKVTGKSFEDKNFESWGLTAQDGMLTYAGALIADESPIWYSRVFCTRWNGVNKSGGRLDALDSAEYTGSILHLLNESANFIKRNMRTMWRKLPMSRENMPDYIERGYFEALVNGLIHRDYLETGSEVHVDIFDDRMEIYSPGGMVDGSFIQNLDIDVVPSKRRNPLLADIFARLDYMERSGSGLEKIRESYESAANYTKEKEPIFFSNQSQFRVTFPNLNYGFKIEREDLPFPDSGLTSDEQVLIKIISVRPEITQNGIASESGFSRAKVQRVMKNLINAGRIAREGSRKNGKWMIRDY